MTLEQYRDISGHLELALEALDRDMKGEATTQVMEALRKLEDSRTLKAKRA